MILTGKCKEDFLKLTSIKESHLKLMLDIYKNALIIKWFDSVGIFIHIEPYLGGGKECFYAKVIYRNELFIDQSEDINNGDYLETRIEATMLSIIKANEIYNKL